ncbi:cryptochrome/photolyase family protein [Sphingomonas sp. CFBP 13720]|uniref:cryptochrome/photolyase family protein n=1 Tax=Sphingomonas sp. CFBP 13720 TaxID=2775302 RepID=UPI0017841859|nr:cryptochrome/photolyase family protein [Sphingomonas sp. CFBP 13720]MBD8678417.1 cryptochrome/photolyase family protein [Sphingomonas sp. CFBP 13720]
MERVLIPVLGDQLSMGLSSLDDADPAETTILMMEVVEEATYVRHHPRKIAFLFAAMRHHAAALRDAGWQVDYVALDDPDNAGSFTGEIARAIGRHDPARIVVTEAGEWRVRGMLESWETIFGVPVEIRADTRFLCGHAEFEAWASNRRELRMEFFYREMRRKTRLLMDGDKPVGGQWNFDRENRKPAKRDLMMPRPLSFAPDAATRDVIALVADRFGGHAGSLDGFDFAVTRDDALRQQEAFLKYALAGFGDNQDAMLTGEPYLWHAVLSPYINAGLLDPLDLCRAVEARYVAGKVPINAAEGFIRQIIGWREFVRGIYWREGPDYVTRNYLDAKRDLPGFYWTGDTDMHCLGQAIGQTLDHAYAHHIQRLMVTGNFALLIGAEPQQVHRWYLEVYADAYEWVELPNTLGMSQFGDGGLLGSKPYASSGAYIDRMSDYCGSCRYDVKQRTGPDACPFNALYWDFLIRNRDKLGGIHRMGMPYRTWDKMTAEVQTTLRGQAAGFLARLDAMPRYDDE